MLFVIYIHDYWQDILKKCTQVYGILMEKPFTKMHSIRINKTNKGGGGSFQWLETFQGQETCNQKLNIFNGVFSMKKTLLWLISRVQFMEAWREQKARDFSQWFRGLTLSPLQGRNLFFNGRLIFHILDVENEPRKTSVPSYVE